MRRSWGMYILVMTLGFLIAFSAVQAVCSIYKVPPIFTPNLSFNARLAFLVDRRSDQPVSVVSGSSIAVYDLDTDLLQASEHKPFVDLGVDGLPIEGSFRLFNQFRGQARVGEVIFATQPYEMKDNTGADFAVPDQTFDRFVSGRMSWFEEMGYHDLSGLVTYFEQLPEMTARNTTSSVAYSATGSVPLDASGIALKRWRGDDTIVADLNCAHCVALVERFCTEVISGGAPFTLFLAPVRRELLAARPDMRAVDADRRARLKDVARRCGGQVFDAAEFVNIGDECFADSLHLNGRGMRLMTMLFIRERRGEHPPRETMISCTASATLAEPADVRRF